MSKKTLIVVACVAAVVVALVAARFSYSNNEIRLRNRAEAQQKKCEIVYDETWKVIAQKAQVADSYKQAFQEIFPALMEGRYGNEKGGALMKFVTESNPNFDISLYKDLSNAIEAKRAVFTREQSELLTINQLHKDALTIAPSSFFVGGRPPLDIKLVTSTRTDTAFATGKDDDVSVFGNK
jgi:hypothetical protein